MAATRGVKKPRWKKRYPTFLVMTDSDDSEGGGSRVGGRAKSRKAKQKEERKGGGKWRWAIYHPAKWPDEAPKLPRSSRPSSTAALRTRNLQFLMIRLGSASLQKDVLCCELRRGSHGRPGRLIIPHLGESRAAPSKRGGGASPGHSFHRGNVFSPCLQGKNDNYAS